MDLGSNVERAMAFKWVTPSITFYHPSAVSSSWHSATWLVHCSLDDPVWCVLNLTQARRQLARSGLH